MKAEDIPKLSKTLWSFAAEKAKSLIIKDASKGIFQTEGAQKPRYASTPDERGSYADYKNRGMRKLGRGSKKAGAGQKLAAFKGKSTDTTTSFVNMRLTGETLRRINAKSIPGGGFKLTFNRGEIVEGNSERGYVLDNLRDFNYRIIEKMIGRELDRNIERFTKEKVVLEVGK